MASLFFNMLLVVLIKHIIYFQLLTVFVCCKCYFLLLTSIIINTLLLVTFKLYEAVVAGLQILIVFNIIPTYLSRVLRGEANLFFFLVWILNHRNNSLLGHTRPGISLYFIIIILVVLYDTIVLLITLSLFWQTVYSISMIW